MAKATSTPAKSQSSSLIEVYQVTDRGTRRILGYHDDVALAKGQIKELRRLYGNEIQIGFEEVAAGPGARKLARQVRKALELKGRRDGSND